MIRRELALPFSPEVGFLLLCLVPAAGSLVLWAVGRLLDELGKVPA